MARVVTVFALLALLVGVFPVPQAQAEATSILFPVLGGASYWNDWGAPRGGGTRSHEGNDLLAPKHTPLLATENGRVSFVAYPQRSWGMSVTISGDSGYRYMYLHMNNDRPGTDDGSALPWFAYAPDISEGQRVRAGQVIGYIGDSGNAEGTTSHVHFEMRNPSGQKINPYDSLVQARVITTPAPPWVQSDEILPYRDLTVGGSIAVGDFDSDSRLEFATAPLAGGGPHVRLYDDDGDELPIGFFAYQRDYPGGLDLTAGDLNGDGTDEIITAPGPGGTAHIRTFTAQGDPYGVEFLAYPEGFSGGASIAAADVDNDGQIEIVTGAGPGGTPHVRVFSANGAMEREFLAYPRDFPGGVHVAAAEGAIVTGPGRGGGPHVKVFDGSDLSLLDEFLAYDGAFRGGIRVAARGEATVVQSPDERYGPTQPDPHEDLRDTSDCEVIVEIDSYGRATAKRVCPNRVVLGSHRTQNDNNSFSVPRGGFEIVTAPASDGGPDIRLFTQSGNRIASSTAYDYWWQGGYDVAIGNNAAWTISGIGPAPNIGRRVSVRELPSRFR